MASLPESLAWLDQHINLEAQAGKVEGLSLERMRRLVDVLGDPQTAYPVIHLTGTNGKGSTARLITALLVEAGLTVGTYTSPHLQRINERISRNGEPIADDDLAEVLSDLRADSSRWWGTSARTSSCSPPPDCAGSPTWRSMSPSSRSACSAGTTPRTCATATVAVVTNVGQDHTDLSGDWRARIAEEKAGIVKPGSTLVLGETDEALTPIFYRAGASGGVGARPRLRVRGERARRRRSPARAAHAVALAVRRSSCRSTARTKATTRRARSPRQKRSSRSRSTKRSSRRPSGRSSVPGRFEIVGREPLVVLDGAHNPEGAAAATATTLHDDFMQEGRRIIVVGMLQPRDPHAILEALEVDDSTLVIACLPDSPRAIPTGEIARGRVVTRRRRHRGARRRPSRRPRSTVSRDPTTRCSSPARSTSSVRPAPGL